MIGLLPWVIGFTLYGSAGRDTARLEGERVVIRPIGISFLVPPVWLGQPVPRGRNYLCGNDPQGSIADRIVTEPSRFQALQHPGGEWKTEFAAVVDSVLPIENLAAHLGGDPWTGSCGTLQMRVYVGDQLSRRTANANSGVRAASRYFKPVLRSHRPRAGGASLGSRGMPGIMTTEARPSSSSGRGVFTGATSCSCSCSAALRMTSTRIAPRLLPPCANNDSGICAPCRLTCVAADGRSKHFG